MNEQPPVNTLGELARVAGGSIGWGGDTTITGIEYDSRLVKPGVMFVAMRGGYADGHDYIAQALDCQPGDWLYGRCNELRGADALTFADIVEILPPAGDAG